MKVKLSPKPAISFDPKKPGKYWDFTPMITQPIHGHTIEPKKQKIPNPASKS